MKKTLITLFTAGMMGAVTASAQTVAPEGINYNYLEGNLALYPSYGAGPGSQDYVGVRVRGAALVAPEVFLFGQLRYLTDDIDFTQAHFGAAYRYKILEDTDLYAGPAIEYMDLDLPGQFGGGSIDEVGFSVRGGIRHRLNEDFEFAGEIRHVFFGGDIDDNWIGITGTVQYFLTQELGLIGEVDIEDGELGLLGGLRYNF